ncbi:MAG: sensor histidine kinase [Oscillospiraceae bacterium]|nr:sensor histidine kinase [Oscillospiraceae bacterium]
MASGMERWRHTSLKQKVAVWLGAILVVMALSAGGVFGVARMGFLAFDRIVQYNLACYELQDALEVEVAAFETYVRENSPENRRNYEAACAVTEACIAALPFDYQRIGQERYARTWNIINGYAGYREYRDAFLASDPGSTDYVETMYRVMDMQEALSHYALRLGRATLEQSQQTYDSRADALAQIPWFFGIQLAATMVCVFFTVRILARKTATPLIRMARESRRIAENDFSGQDLAVESHDEVGELTQAFNRMKHAMREHLATREALHREELERLELEKNLDRTRLEMLKSQVNPHFLFNTLNMISCVARLEEAPVTNRMVLHLGNLFRYNLRTKEQEVFLEQELEALDDYIQIQQMRFDGRVTFRKLIRVDPGSVKIPSFTLQPLVENAFVHGMAAREEGGVITLRVRQAKDHLVITVADNGKGMTPLELEALRQKIRDSEQTGRGIGLGNISRRVAMLYPGGKFEIFSKPGRGTVIRIMIPKEKRMHDVQNSDCGG